MSAPFRPHLESLPEPQRSLWSELRPVRELGMVLYGGTAIALRLGHRTSVDFDFFTERTLDRAELFSVLPFLRRALVLQDQPNTLSILVGNGDEASGVNVSLFGGLTFGRVGEPGMTADGVLQVASLDDLMATKLKVVLQRVEAKDYIDIAAMIEAGVSLERGLAGARELYGMAFQPSECLKALVYFEGGDLDRLPQHVRDLLIAAARDVRALPAVGVISKQLAQSPAQP